MAKQVENNLKKKEENNKEKQESNKKLNNKPAGERVNRLNNSHLSWQDSLRRPW